MRAAWLFALIAGFGACHARAADPPPLGADAFDRATLGYTLGYSHLGETYGHEQYLPDRRVIWAYGGEECLKGRWHQSGEQICFNYDREGPLQCWRFWLQDGQLIGRFGDDPAGTELYETSRSRDDLPCAAPEVGM